MPKIKEICSHVRSKNAGPFWITVDFFFEDADLFSKYCDSEALGAELFASLYGVDATQVKRIPVESLKMIKVSYPRLHPQGWRGERDMHSGQQFARLLDVEVA